DEVQRAHGLKTGGAQIVAGEDVERLADHETAAGRRSNGIDVVYTVVQLQRRAPDRFVLAEVAEADVAAAEAHAFDELLRDAAFVKLFRAAVGDALQRGRELGLLERRSCRESVNLHLCSRRIGPQLRVRDESVMRERRLP